jgi:zinc transport system ATP-binding protein
MESQQVDHSKNIIEIKGVSFNYGNTEILKDITFNIHQGDYLGIVGPNGAGKTTLLKLILGVLPLSGGSVTLFGKDILHFNDRVKIGYVPQKATSFDVNFPATVGEVVAMGRCASIGLFKHAGASDRLILENSLRQVGMQDFKNRLIGDLSAGQQQRVFIARALASQPEIIFLDEPTTGIDSASQDDFYAVLKNLNQQYNVTIVLVSHDIERITKEAMHIACVDKTLVCHTSSEEFLRESTSLHVSGKKIKVISTHRHHS